MTAVTAGWLLSASRTPSVFWLPRFLRPRMREQLDKSLISAAGVHRQKDMCRHPFLGAREKAPAYLLFFAFDFVVLLDAGLCRLSAVLYTRICEVCKYLHRSGRDGNHGPMRGWQHGHPTNARAAKRHVGCGKVLAPNPT
mmetsp:Transcript_17063/g.47636  ORF Transcript_17063/g.47636 Transcript_17063/m.47636 type:complete len:140 (-) Transcript_17063:194-613(-)